MPTGQRTDGLVETIADALSAVSDEFDHWDQPYVRGPGLYVLVVDGRPAAYSEPMGDARWPVERCDNVLEDPDEFVATAGTVGMSQDGAVVVQADGSIARQMVRLHDRAATDTPGHEEALEFRDWMGARHMSAMDASVRENVVAAVTLSEEDGDVSLFVDGDLRRRR